MASKHATLTVVTPDEGRPLPPPSMLDRCALLGAPACQFDAQGTFIADGPAPELVKAWLASPPIRARLKAAVMDARDHADGTALTTMFRGCTVTVVAHRVGTMHAGFTAAVLLSSDAFTHNGFIEGCRAAGIDHAAVARQARTLARFDGTAADLAARALAAAGADLETIEDQGAALTGFTVQLTDSYDTMDLLYSVGRSMREPYRPEQFVSLVCQRLFTTLSFRWVAIRLAEEPWIASGLRGQVVFAGELPCPQETLRSATIPLMTAGPYPQVLDDVPHLSTGAARQVLSQPIMCKGKPVGILVVGGKHGGDPDVSSYDIQLIEAAAGYINAFADNVALYEDQRNLFMGTVQALTAAIDAKDRYTFGHSERVAHLASSLATHTGMPRAEAERVRIAGLVHDVGKIGVPEAVLTKSGSLTKDEYEAIKRHPEIGYAILRDIKLLDDVLPGVLHHHERFDGKGYPHGLSGEKIPHIARLLAVADTFDAMSSTRSYRGAMPRERVRAEIASCAGTQFDPALARAFLTMDLTEYDRLVARHAALHLALAA